MVRGTWGLPSGVVVTEADAALEDVIGSAVTLPAASVVDWEDRLEAAKGTVELVHGD